MEDVIKIESMSLKYKGSDSYANEEINLSIKKRQYLRILW